MKGSVSHRAPIAVTVALVFLSLWGVACSGSAEEQSVDEPSPDSPTSPDDAAEQASGDAARQVSEAAVVNEPGDGVAPDPSPDRVSVGVPELGDSVWAVVVAGASDPFDPILEDTVGLVTDAGHDTTITNCDEGAAEAIGMLPDASFTVSVYAATPDAAAVLHEELAAAGLPGAISEVLVRCP